MTWLTLSCQFFCLQLLLLCSQSYAKLCSPDQSYALLQFKQLFSFENSSSFSCHEIMVPSYPKMLSWKEGNDCCSWDGISCDTEMGHVIGLDLSCSWLLGSIPSNSSIFILPHLQWLNLAHNDFKYSHIPSSFNQFPDLKLLNLSHSNFSGQLPSEISQLSELVSLDLSFNSELSLENPVLELLVRNLTMLREFVLDSVDLSTIVPGSFTNLSSSLTTLSLSHCGLQGNFPDSVFHLPNLWNLILASNSNLTGIFPNVNWSSPLQYLDVSYVSFSGELPDSIGNLKSLRYLDLSNCNFDGSLPASLGNLTKLTVLILTDNNFGSRIPSFLSNLRNLDVLHLPGNNFIGEIPDIFVNLTQLSYLSFANNQLTGPIPSYMSRLQSLVTLDLYVNLLSGSIPSWLFTLPRLEIIDLGYNQLIGRIVEIHSKPLRVFFLDSNRLYGSIPLLPPNLEIFRISNNKLTGEIPHSICNMNVIGVLDLANNSLSGTIPECIGIFSTRIRVLDLRRNKFYGRIPDTFAKNNHFRTLNFNNNGLGGSLPRSLVNCTELRVLDIGNNNIYDIFPHWLGSLPYVQVLLLSSNKFYGYVEGSFEDNLSFTKLRIFDVSNNNFSGSLPGKYFKSLQAMIDVGETEGLEYMGEEYYPDYVTITLKGSDIELGKVIYTLTIIDFSLNNFDGEIPESIASLHALRNLNLSHNNLIGSIPSSFENLTALESLDLSSNRLVGEIPWQLTKLNFLQILNLSQNQLTGPIPRATHFDTFPNDSYIGNSGLCGFPLSNPCDTNGKTPQPFSILEDNLESGNGFGWKVVLIGYGCGTVFGMIMGYLFFLTRKPRWLLNIIEGKQF